MTAGRRFAGRRSRGGRSSGGGVAPPAVEAPESVPGLKAWFDSRTDAYFTFSTGAQISVWASRAGSIGAVSWLQASSTLQPVRALSVATLGSKNAVQFDGADDYFDTNNASAWKFLHDGSGASRFWIGRMDSTGGVTQVGVQNGGVATETGFLAQASTSSIILRVCNGSGTFLNGWTLSTTGHWNKDVSRWQMWGYATGTQHSRVSGSSVSNTDAGGQTPSAANPTRALRMGASSVGANPVKGYVAQDIWYDHVLTAGELTSLATWANQQYGVAI